MPCGVSRSADDKRNISLVVTRSSVSSKWDHIAFSDVCVLQKWARIAQSVYRIAKSRKVRESNTGVCEILRTIPDRPWGSHSLLYNGYRLSFHGGRGVALAIPHLAPRIKKEYRYTSTPIWVSIACSGEKCNFLLFTCVLCKGRQKLLWKWRRRNLPKRRSISTTKLLAVAASKMLIFTVSYLVQCTKFQGGLMKLDFW